MFQENKSEFIKRKFRSNR